MVGDTLSTMVGEGGVWPAARRILLLMLAVCVNSEKGSWLSKHSSQNSLGDRSSRSVYRDTSDGLGERPNARMTTFPSLSATGGSRQETVRTDDRSGKLFSVFSIVSFPNEACVSTLDQTNGTCLSPADCRTIGGALEGSCASGFGTCCVVRLGTCGGVVTTNTTVLQNPSFPGSYNTPGMCVYLVKKQNTGICQIRLDYQTFNTDYNTASPTGCVSGSTDYMEFNAPNELQYPAVCGNLAGQHMYFDVGTDEDSLEINLNLVGTSDREWNILVSQIACTDPWRAPDDCLQYHTGVQGYFESFNFANGQILSNQAYRICIRQELDYCSISYKPSSDSTPDSFELLTGTTGTTTTVANCQKTYIGIPFGGDTGVKDSRANRYCGSYLDSSEGSTRNGQVSSAVVPFDVFVFSDRTPLAGISSGTADKSGATGFNIYYRQIPCLGIA